MRDLVRGLRNFGRDPSARSVLAVGTVVIAVGTVFYRVVEDLRWIDAVYFSVITLTTVGYGTRGYEDPPDVERRRHLYFGITLNMSEVLRQTVFRGNTKPTTVQRASELFFEFIQRPGTAAPLAKHQF